MSEEAKSLLGGLLDGLDKPDVDENPDLVEIKASILSRGLSKESMGELAAWLAAEVLKRAIISALTDDANE